MLDGDIMKENECFIQFLQIPVQIGFSILMGISPNEQNLREKRETYLHHCDKSVKRYLR